MALRVEEGLCAERGRRAHGRGALIEGGAGGDSGSERGREEPGGLGQGCGVVRVGGLGRVGLGGQVALAFGVGPRAWTVGVDGSSVRLGLGLDTINKFVGSMSKKFLLNFLSGLGL